MITTITEFAMPEPITLEEAKQIFSSTAPTYREVPGLLRKTYLFSEDGKTMGGVYFWTSRQAAEAMYTPEWRAFVKEKYDTEPRVTYFESPVVVDNVAGEIIAE